ncbi:MAG TPA: hypothetical protein DIC53_11595 [Synergistaceae bacterium]|nr:hypothetical protein [Synergistaceae bacterium]
MKRIVRGLLVCVLGAAVCTASPVWAEKPVITVANTGTSIKAAMIVLAHQMGYYGEEGLDVRIEQISNLNEGATAVQMGKLDVLPLGIIPTAVFVSKGADLVVFGGTIAEGSQAVTLPENRDMYEDLAAFRGKKVAVVRPETGHMIMKALIRKAGVDPERDMEYIILDGFQSVIESVRKGAVDVGFVNSGFGFIAEKQGLAVAFNVGKWAPGAVCCRQTTSRAALESKRGAFVKFQVANLRAFELFKNDERTTIRRLAEFSGQPEDYVRHCLYGGVMIYTLDPVKKRVLDFYEVMKANGDIDPATPYGMEHAVDTTVYRDALREVRTRFPESEVFLKLEKEFAENN